MARSKSLVAVDSSEWNFDSVPAEELEVCVLWEYGRESGFLRSVRERSGQCAGTGISYLERVEFVERDFRKAFNAIGRKAILFQQGIYGFGGYDHFPDFACPFPRAWQTLSQFERSVLLKTTEWSAKALVGFPGFRRAQYADALALPKLFKPKPAKEVLGGVRDLPVRDFYRSGHKLRSICPNYMDANGKEVLIVGIDWGQFTNEQLVEEFAQWLKENDPPGLARPDKRGRKQVSHRVNLERLGILRLLHRHPVDKLKTAYPVAWKRYHTPNRRWRRDVVAAKQVFRDLFPFLPPEEQPACWPPQDDSIRPE